MTGAVDPMLVMVLDDLSALATINVLTSVTLVVQGATMTGQVAGDIDFWRRLGDQQASTFESASDLMRQMGRFSAYVEILDIYDDPWTYGRRRRDGFERYGECLYSEAAKRLRGRLSHIKGHPDMEQRLEDGKRIGNESENETFNRRTHCHLKNVRLSQGGGVIREIPYLRIRIADVSAWAVDQLPVDQE